MNKLITFGVCFMLVGCHGQVKTGRSYTENICDNIDIISEGVQAYAEAQAMKLLEEEGDTFISAKSKTVKSYCINDNTVAFIRHVDMVAYSDDGLHRVRLVVEVTTVVSFESELSIEDVNIELLSSEQLAKETKV